MNKILDYKTGIIIDEEENFTTLFQQPRYVKMHLDDLAAILELSSGNRYLLYELTQRIDRNGTIVLKKTTKDEIADRLKITLGTLDNSLTKLVHMGVLKRIGRGKFSVNPHLFARRNWADLNGKHLYFEKGLRITVTYLSSGARKIESTVI